MSGIADHGEAVSNLLLRPPVPVMADPEAMMTLAELLGRPDQAFPSILVPDLGDGAALGRIVTTLLSALDLSVGFSAREHLQDLRERIRVGPDVISREAFAARFAELAPFLAEVDARHADPVSRDEALTALAWMHFADLPVHVAVFSGGLGARTPDLARAEVVVLAACEDPDAPTGSDGLAAGDHAGLVAEGGLVVAGPHSPQAMERVREQCSDRQAELVAVNPGEALAARRLAVGGQQLDIRGRTGLFEDLYLPLHGYQQAVNATLGLIAVEGFLGFAGGLDVEVIRKGLAAVRAPGRLEVVRRTDASPVLLDVADDAAAAARSVAALREEFAFRHRVLVVGTAGEEDGGVLAPFLDHVEHVVVVAPSSLTAPDSERVDAMVQEVGKSIERAADMASALELASGLAAREDAVVVIGSASMIGAARRALGLGVE